MKKTALTASLITAALIATTAFAQMGSGMGGGMGPGMGEGQGRSAWNKDVTPGWTLMTQQERTDWQKTMRAVTTYDECKTLQAAHHQAMEARAQEKGVKLPAPGHNGCDMMKTRGMFN